MLCGVRWLHPSNIVQKCFYNNSLKLSVSPSMGVKATSDVVLNLDDRKTLNVDKCHAEMRKRRNNKLRLFLMTKHAIEKTCQILGSFQAQSNFALSD